MNAFPARRWALQGLFGLAVVALWGTMMRYKIAFSFPYLEQKNLLHAHSHFAFSGWITHLLYAGIAIVCQPFLPRKNQKAYYYLIAANMLCAWGMLIAFTIQGYQAVSISFSTLSILVAVAFAVLTMQSAKFLPHRHPVKTWGIAGLLLQVLSAAGPFALAYMLATKNIDHHLYLGAVYYFLHFQYNGWFFFGTMALVAAYLPVNVSSLKKYFWLFACTIAPAFFLSILWVNLPGWLYYLTVIASLVQLIAWIYLLRQLWAAYKRGQHYSYPKWVHIFFAVAATGLTIKFILQAISVIPSLSQLVFGIRPIVIAYLHLVLLAVYSQYLLGFMFAQKLLQPTAAAKAAALGFLAAVVLNETLLGIQGFAAFAYVPIPYINEMLFAVAALLLLTASALYITQMRGSNRQS
ncbi:MAG TPA: hypothetical protein PKC69_06005 [Chitinophagaceae bacterium]|nr:hypothetical protein [Chitinophagaceae bacterium]